MSPAAKAAAFADLAEVEFVYDGSPTKDGHDWYCNGCQFQCNPIGPALDHAAEHKDGAFPHHVWERSRPPADGIVPKGSRRRIVVRDGVVTPEVQRRKRAA